MVFHRMGGWTLSFLNSGFLIIFWHTLLDGHSTHYQPNVIKAAAKEQVIVFCFPLHTSHMTQPLDSSCFGAFKRSWVDECHKYVSFHKSSTKLGFVQ